MKRLKRWLYSMTAGLGLSVLLAEALIALGGFCSGQSTPMVGLAAGETPGAASQAGLMAIWLSASLAGAAWATALARSATAGLAAGLLPGLALAFTAFVGSQPDALSLSLGLTPLLGSLVGMRLAQHLIRLDRTAAIGAPNTSPGL